MSHTARSDGGALRNTLVGTPRTSMTSIAKSSSIPVASAMGPKLSDCSVPGTLLAVATSARRPGKAAIMRAAVEVIAEDGFEGASTRDMAARAGVSVAALYHHFPSKLGLLREFLDEAYDVTLARIERRLEAVEGPVARLEEVVGTLIWTHVYDEFV